MECQIMNDASLTEPVSSPLPALGTGLTQGTDHLLTERLNEALWQTQTHQLQWFKLAEDGYLVTDAHGVIHEANYAAAELLNARKEFLLGKPLGLFMTDA